MLLSLSMSWQQHVFIQFIWFSLSKTSAIMLKVVKRISSPWNTVLWHQLLGSQGLYDFSTWATPLSSRMALVELVWFLVWFYHTKIQWSYSQLEDQRSSELTAYSPSCTTLKEKWIANERCFKMNWIKVLLIFWVMFACSRNIAYAWVYDLTVTISLIL